MASFSRDTISIRERLDVILDEYRKSILKDIRQEVTAMIRAYIPNAKTVQFSKGGQYNDEGYLDAVSIYIDDYDINDLIGDSYYGDRYHVNDEDNDEEGSVSLSREDADELAEYFYDLPLADILFDCSVFLRLED